MRKKRLKVISICTIF